MQKSELQTKLLEEYQQWESFLGQIDPRRMDQPGVNGVWSMKDLVAHLTSWNQWLVIRIQAALHSEPEPVPSWPSQLQTEDEINAWIYDANRARSTRDILGESRQVFQELFMAIAGLPEDVKIEKIEPKYYLIWVGDQRFEAGEFFNHFHDDHEQDVRAWLERGEKP